MEPSEEQLTDIGRTIRTTLTAELDEAEQLRVARRGLLERVAAGNEASRLRRPWPRLRWAVAALCVAGASAGAVLMSMRSPITFQVGGAGVQGRTGDVIEATADAPLALNFSEGSSIVLREESRVRVLEAEAAGARVLVEAGAVDVAIVHRTLRSTRWRFEVGPFRVLVTGTRFRAGWSPVDQTLSVSMLEGSVVISGRCMESPRIVSAGQKQQISCSPATSLPPQRPIATKPATAESQADAEPGPTDARERAERTPPAVESWRALLGGGRLRDALRAAESTGFDRVCRSASAKELLGLADAARLSGRMPRATEALGVVRKRFPHSPDASNAAFALGRIAFERHSAYDEAVRWFATYVDEQPTGALIGDAVGRLMEARHRSGDRPGARADAERYLRRFPEGPYAREARSILAER